MLVRVALTFSSLEKPSILLRYCRSSHRIEVLISMKSFPLRHTMLDSLPTARGPRLPVPISCRKFLHEWLSCLLHPRSYTFSFVLVPCFDISSVQDLRRQFKVTILSTSWR